MRNLRDKSGKFQKGNKGFWLDKKRPEVQKWLNSKEAIKKRSKTMTGRNLPIEHRKNISKSKKGVSIWGGLGGRIGKMPWMRGKNHPMWKGGITKEETRIRKSVEYKLWRKSVFERDNYTCRFCGVHGGYLEADHIKPFALFPELRFSIDNGRTLCLDCHRKTDTWGWRTRERLTKD